MKRAAAVILLLALLFSGLPVYAASDDDAYTYFANSGKNLKGQSLNIEITRTTGYLIFGTPEQVPENGQKKGLDGKQQWRYFGFDIMGNPFSNMYFPNDADSGRQPWEKQWIENPWDTKNSGGLFLCRRSELWRDPMAQVWLDKITPAWPGWDGSKFHDYLNIQSPPTNYTPGSARGWHMVAGKAWYQTFVLAPLTEMDFEANDLSITGLTLDEQEGDNPLYKPGDSVQGQFILKNDSTENITGGNYEVFGQIMVNGEETKRWPVTDLPAGHETTVGFVVHIPEDYMDGSLQIEARVNMIDPRQFIEPIYENNYMSVDLMQDIPDSTDLEVTKISASQIHQGQDYTTVTVGVRNNSAANLVENVPVRLLINGSQVSSKPISLGPKAATQILFRVDVPGGFSSFAAAGEINHTRIVDETTYANNKKAMTVSILPASDPGSCSTSSTTWTEYRTVAAYSSGSKIENHYISVRHSERRSYTKADGSTGHRTRVWFTQELVGYTVKFTATLHASVTVSPDPVKSGYGVDVTANTWVTTNYDKPGSLSNAQAVWAYAPSGSPIKLEAVKGSTSSLDYVTWRLPAKVTKALLTRKHYIPVSWPDGSYKITIRATDVSGPASVLCRTANDTVMINGNMHEDDYTGSKGN